MNRAKSHLSSPGTFDSFFPDPSGPILIIWRSVPPLLPPAFCQHFLSAFTSDDFTAGVIEVGRIISLGEIIFLHSYKSCVVNPKDICAFATTLHV